MSMLRITIMLAALLVSAAAVQAQCPQLQKLTAFDGQLQDRYGNDVSTSGNRAAVAEKLDTQGGSNAGAVYVYDATGGSFALDQKIVPADIDPEDLFGFSVSLDGTLLAVGSYTDDDAGSNAGAVYIFRRDATQWVQEAKLLPPGGATLGFGSDVALHNGTLVVGTFPSDRADFFIRTGTTWSHQGTVTASNPFAQQFGGSVDVQGNTAIIGARASDIVAGNGGAAYVFTRVGGVWSETQELVPGDLSAFDQFGTSVAIDGRLLVIGTPFQSTHGTAYTYTATGFGSYAFDSKLTPAGAFGSNSLFGFSVALHGGRALVGAQAMDTSAGSGTGAAYQYNRSGGAWTQVGQLVASDAAGGDTFGNAVAIHRISLIGAEFDSNANGGLAGAAYVFGVCP